MRVLYCTDTYPPQINGVSIVTALSVSGLRDRGWECAVIAPLYPKDPQGRGRGEFGDADDETSIPSVALPPYPDIRLAAPAFGRVAEAVGRFQPDLVHCETEFMIGRLGQIAAARAGVPLVSSYHTDFSRYADAYGVPWLRGPVSRYIARFHGRSRRTYTPSHAAKLDLQRLGVRNVEVWGRGVDIETFSPLRRSIALRAAYGLDGQFVFLYVGRLAAEKGVALVLDGFREASRLLPNGSIHLVIAGAGPEEAALRAAAPRNVTFLGVLDRVDALPRLYASADAFVFASLTETLGLVVLEAMSSGLPVIATPAGGVAEHLVDGANGLAFPPRAVDVMAREMVSLALNPDARARLSRGARRTAEGLSWQAELDRLDASYRDLCISEDGERPSADPVIRTA